MAITKFPVGCEFVFFDKRPWRVHDYDYGGRTVVAIRIDDHRCEEFNEDLLAHAIEDGRISVRYEPHHAMSYTPAVGDDVQYFGRCHNWRGIHFVVLGGDPPRARQHCGALDLDMSVEPDRWHRIGRNGILDRDMVLDCCRPALRIADPTPTPNHAYVVGFDPGVNHQWRRAVGSGPDWMTPIPLTPPYKMKMSFEYAPTMMDANELAKRLGMPLGIPPPSHIWRNTGDPLDDCVDGVTLRRLLELDENLRRDVLSVNRTTVNRATYFSELQHAAISAHWVKRLREKQGAALELELERERNQVVVDLDW